MKSLDIIKLADTDSAIEYYSFTEHEIYRAERLAVKKNGYLLNRDMSVNVTDRHISAVLIDIVEDLHNIKELEGKPLTKSQMEALIWIYFVPANTSMARYDCNFSQEKYDFYKLI